MTAGGTGQRGAALIFAMLLVSAMATLLVFNQQFFSFSWQLYQGAQSKQQAREFAHGAEALAIVALRRQAEQDTTHLKQWWASADNTYPIEGGQVSGRVRDAQNCFNLNGLTYGREMSAAGVASVQRTLVMQQFLSVLSLSNTLVADADKVLERTLDWIDQDIQLAGAQGAESADYQLYAKPFYTPDSAFGDLSEMLLWQLPAVQRVMDSALFCTRPSRALPSVNVNTLQEAQAVQLAGLFFGQLSVASAREFIRNRPANGYAAQQDFLPSLLAQASLSDAQRALLQQQLLLRSYWFEVDVDVVLEGRREFLRSYVQVPREGPAKVYRRIYGAL
ncbi:MAG: type II secretion system minor pseudopilin GspK [Pseudomonadales bacterium]